VSHSAPIPARITGWDRAAIVALGGAGCALSYDALQQMAVAIHVRGFLTFLFPLVIDGFIAYGVRALLVLRTASLAARCYVWMLFGTATAASIWANALHAVRLNQQHPTGGGLRLSNLTVGALSTLAPLALAGAVHLYILIARRVTETEDAGHPVTSGGGRTDRITVDRPDVSVRPGNRRPVPVTSAAGRPVTLAVSPAPEPAVRADNAPSDTEEPADRGALPGPREAPAEPEPEHGQSPDLGGDPVSRPTPVTVPKSAKCAAASDTVQDTGGRTSHGSGDRRSVRATDAQLLEIGRRAVTEAGNLTRQVVGEAIRAAGYTLASDRLTTLMRLLRAEAGRASDTETG
jgi:hypothetical protein